MFRFASRSRRYTNNSDVDVWSQQTRRTRCTRWFELQQSAQKWKHQTLNWSTGQPSFKYHMTHESTDKNEQTTEFNT